MNQHNNHAQRTQLVSKSTRFLLILLSTILLLSCIVACEKQQQQSTDNNLNKTHNSKSSLETTTPQHSETKLSNVCDILLCTGYDGNTCYELVANQIDGYPDSTFEFGVIKNNKWLVEMTPNCPFIDETGWWKGLNKSYQSNKPSEEDFEHIGGSVFLYKESTIYNPETQVIFENLCNRNYYTALGGNYIEFVGFERRRHESGTSIDFKYFNTQTGETKKIGGFFNDVQRPDKLTDISEGLFYASGETWTWYNFQYTRYSGFFDLNGTMILDLSEYSITDYGGYKYQNGKYTITCANNSGVRYNITFDTSGKIISQEKAEN